MDLGQNVHKISYSHGMVIPVLDRGGTLLGEIDITKIRHVVFRIELYHHFTARQLMLEPPAILADRQTMAEVMRAFERTHADWVPVVDKDNRLEGYISRQRLYTQYRNIVADMSRE